MSAYELEVIRNSVNALGKKIDAIEELLTNVNGRLAHIEHQRMPALEHEVDARYKQVTEHMHDSLCATSKAHVDCLRMDIIKEVQENIRQMIVQHENVLHAQPKVPPFTAVPPQ